MDTRQIVQAYFDRLNSEDWEALGELFHEDAVLEAPGFPRQRGRDTVRTYFRSALGIYPEHYDDPVRIIVAGDIATVNIHYEGTLANGYQLSFDAVDVFEMRDGLIGELTSWYDSYAVRQALLEGRTRSAGAEGDRARLRTALTGARGSVHALGGRWSGEAPSDVLCVPAIVLDADGELTAEQVAGQPTGWALLVRGATVVDPSVLEGRPAGGTDGAVTASGETPWVTGLALAAVPAATQGVLVAAPSSDGAANALLIA
jgi:ketosteroid isomerase-like protein